MKSFSKNSAESLKNNGSGNIIVNGLRPNRISLASYMNKRASALSIDYGKDIDSIVGEENEEDEEFNIDHRLNKYIENDIQTLYGKESTNYHVKDDQEIIKRSKHNLLNNSDICLP